MEEVSLCLMTKNRLFISVTLEMVTCMEKLGKFLETLMIRQFKLSKIGAMMMKKAA
jgi:hypothetical protein